MEMRIRYNVKGKERRGLPQAISEVLNTVPCYKVVPSFVYEIGGCSLDREGMLTFDESFDSKSIERLKEELAKKGFVPIEEKQEPEVECGFEIDMPREQFTEVALENLKRIVDAKGGLIASAIGAGNVKIIVTEDRVRLPWFPEPKSKEELDIYLRFAEAVCNMAKTQKRVIATATAILIEDGSWFVVKRNLRRGEPKVEWLENVKSFCKNISTPREAKTIYIGSSWKDVTYIDAEKNEKTICMRIVYEVIERTIDKHGQYLLTPDIEVNTLWTNLGMTDNEIIALYHAHGESEQFHSEIKTDMDIERLPSGKFETNELVLELTILAYNILRLIGQQSLKSSRSPKLKREVNRRRIRTVISNLIQIAGHITEHSRKVILALGCSNLWRFAFMDIYHRFAFVR